MKTNSKVDAHNASVDTETSVKTFSRRSMLKNASVLGGTAAALSAVPEDVLAATWGGRDLGELITARTITNPGTAFAGPSQLYYPDWLQGEWHATSKFVAFDAPLGNRFVPAGALESIKAPAEYGGLGNVVEYDLRYYPPAGDELGAPSAFGFSRGAPPKDKVVADRKVNTKSTTNAFMGYAAVQRVEYDPTVSPTKLVVQFSELTPDMQPVGPKRVELFINNRAGQGEDVFLCSELYRQVVIGARRVDVTDYELISKYEHRTDGSVEVRQRSVVYLQPQDNLYFDANNRSVAVYDYKIDLARRTE